MATRSTWSCSSSGSGSTTSRGSRWFPGFGSGYIRVGLSRGSGLVLVLLQVPVLQKRKDDGMFWRNFRMQLPGPVCRWTPGSVTVGSGTGREPAWDYNQQPSSQRTGSVLLRSWRIRTGFPQVSQVPSSVSGSLRCLQVPSGVSGSLRCLRFPQGSQVPSGVSGSLKCLRFPQVSQVPSSVSGSLRCLRFPQVSQVSPGSLRCLQVPSSVSGSLKCLRFPQVSQVPSGVSGSLRCLQVPSGVSRFPQVSQVPSGVSRFPQVSQVPSGISGSLRSLQVPSGVSRFPQVSQVPSGVSGSLRRLQVRLECCSLPDFCLSGFLEEKVQLPFSSSFLPSSSSSAFLLFLSFLRLFPFMNYG
ncbi:uncharacterized protein LOC107834498 isoform X2 [Poecilia formosa]|uniref:uncharacterized protein LOC107834498 isoform X2 n=1 Tax=Poecilia formosa TaxID=48698 RepID=UPI0007B7F9FA|nr:PREDICTED: uncharacterized protein LOC107834498 isoform X2 [Poecilia formosa]